MSSRLCYSKIFWYHLALHWTAEYIQQQQKNTTLVIIIHVVIELVCNIPISEKMRKLPKNNSRMGTKYGNDPASYFQRGCELINYHPKCGRSMEAWTEDTERKIENWLLHDQLLIISVNANKVSISETCVLFMRIKLYTMHRQQLLYRYQAC